MAKRYVEARYLDLDAVESSEEENDEESDDEENVIDAADVNMAVDDMADDNMDGEPNEAVAEDPDVVAVAPNGGINLLQVQLFQFQTESEIGRQIREGEEPSFSGQANGNEKSAVHPDLAKRLLTLKKPEPVGTGQENVDPARSKIVTFGDYAASAPRFNPAPAAPGEGASFRSPVPISMPAPPISQAQSVASSSSGVPSTSSTSSGGGDRGTKRQMEELVENSTATTYGVDVVSEVVNRALKRQCITVKQEATRRRQEAAKLEAEAAQRRKEADGLDAEANRLVEDQQDLGEVVPSVIQGGRATAASTHGVAGTSLAIPVSATVHCTISTVTSPAANAVAPAPVANSARESGTAMLAEVLAGKAFVKEKFKKESFMHNAYVAHLQKIAVSRLVDFIRGSRIPSKYWCLFAEVPGPKQSLTNLLNRGKPSGSLEQDSYIRIMWETLKYVQLNPGYIGSKFHPA